MLIPSPTICPPAKSCSAPLLERFHDLERQLDEFVATTERIARSYACLKEEYLVLKRLLFGPRRERLPEAAGQQHLFDDDAPPPPPVESADAAPDEESPSRKRKKGHGRRQIPDHLPRTDVPHDVPPEERVCDCGRDKVADR